MEEGFFIAANKHKDGGAGDTAIHLFMYVLNCSNMQNNPHESIQCRMTVILTAHNIMVSAVRISSYMNIQQVCKDLLHCSAAGDRDVAAT